MLCSCDVNKTGSSRIMQSSNFYITRHGTSWEYSTPRLKLRPWLKSRRQLTVLCFFDESDPYFRSRQSECNKLCICWKFNNQHFRKCSDISSSESQTRCFVNFGDVIQWNFKFIVATTNKSKPEFISRQYKPTISLSQATTLRCQSLKICPTNFFGNYFVFTEFFGDLSLELRAATSHLDSTSLLHQHLKTLTFVWIWRSWRER